MKNEELYEVRDAKVKGTDDEKWVWLKRDSGAWDGPLTDWNDSHFASYVEPVLHKEIVVTAGGNMGMYVRPYSQLFKRVYVFEPDMDNFYALVRNNHAENVFFFRAALGKKPGFCRLNKSMGGNAGVHRTVEDDMGETPVMTVDQLCLPRLDLLQLDVEGAEESIITGARETIQKYSPLVVMESNSQSKELENLGYTRTGKSKADYIYKKG